MYEGITITEETNNRENLNRINEKEHIGKQKESLNRKSMAQN